jgi:peptidoglycan hydrolase-like protein with peptidoglycan-binding domain
MGKKIIRLTESDLTQIVKRVIREQNQMSGEEVFDLQSALNDYFKLKNLKDKSGKPYIIGTDGKWGPSTIDALKLFQTTEKLPIDGVAGPDVYNRLHQLGLDQGVIDSLISGLKKAASFIGSKVSKMF